MAPPLASPRLEVLLLPLRFLRRLYLLGLSSLDGHPFARWVIRTFLLNLGFPDEGGWSGDRPSLIRRTRGAFISLGKSVIHGYFSLYLGGDPPIAVNGVLDLVGFPLWPPY
jgi:hypothetical protein